MWTARLLFGFPDMLSRPCKVCEEFMYEDGIGTMGPPVMLESGEQMKRPKGCDTPCHQCPKIPKDAPERTRAHAIEPTEKSLQALRFYQQCKAVGRHPEDDIVEQNAGLIAPIEREAELARARDAAGVLALMLAGGKRV